MCSTAIIRRASAVSIFTKDLGIVSDMGRGAGFRCRMRPLQRCKCS